MTNKETSCTSKVIFRIGQILLLWSIVMYFIGMITSHWVDRPDVDYYKFGIQANETLVTKHYGIFQACRQKGSLSVGFVMDNDKDSKRFLGSGSCGAVWDYLNFVEQNTVVYIQIVMGLSAVLYIGSVALEVFQFLPIQMGRNFIAANRVVELFASVASVLALHGMVIFAGEVKNNAELVPGQEEENVGWSFVVTLVGLGISVVALVLVVMFRELPIPNSDIGGSWLRSQQ